MGDFGTDLKNAMLLVFQFCFICLILLHTSVVLVFFPHPSHHYLQLSWWIESKGHIWCFYFPNILHLGFLALQILMLRIFLFNTIHFLKSVYSPFKTQNKEWCSIIVSQTLFWLFLVLCFCVVTQSALKSFCTVLATAAFWNTQALAFYICTYV